MKEKIIEFVKRYKIIPLSLLAIGCVIFRLIAITFIVNVIHITEKSKIYPFWNYSIMLFVFAIWAIISFRVVRQQRYNILTGRDFEKDKNYYKQTYRELVDFYTHNDKYIINPDELEELNLQESNGAILCKVKDKSGKYKLVHKESSGAGNLITFGIPDCGKTTTQAATTAIMHNKDISEAGCGVFAISIKGDLLKFINGRRHNVKVFTPDKAENSAHYNPLFGVEKMDWTDRRIFAENMSIIICPEEQGDNAKFWYEGAQNCLSGIILYLLFLHDNGTIAGKLVFPEIIDCVLNNNGFKLLHEIEECGCSIPGEYTNGFIGSNEKNFAGIWGHLCKCIRPFNNGALRTLFDGEGDCITPEFLDEGDIYIDVPQDKYKVYAPCMAIIVTNFIQSFMRRDDISSGRELVPIVFLLDEFPELHLDYGLLSSAMSTLRSKKVSLFLLMQSLAQLEEKYGEIRSRVIVDLCKYVSVFNVQDPKSREYFKRLVGRHKVLKRSTSISTSQSDEESNTTGITISEEMEFIFEEADFGKFNLIDEKTGDKIYRALVYIEGNYIVGETIHYTEI